MYKAAFCLAYYGMMRVGELTYSPHLVKACDVFIGTNKKKIMMILRSSKTHGEELPPQKIKITAEENVKRKLRKINFYPFKCARDFMLRRGPYVDESEQFIVYQDHSPVRPEQYRSTLRSMLKKLNLNAQLYDTHSMRVGRVHDMVKMGYIIEQIKTAGRWKSNAIYKYLKQN